MGTKSQDFILKGTVIYNIKSDEGYARDNSYIVCVDGRSCGVFEEIPEKYKDLSVIDYGDKLILPGMTDLHLHAPQYTFRGTGMDCELMDWLNKYTFPEESRYQDIEYADTAYSIFVEDLKHTVATRAVCFATIHRGATKLLMDKLEDSGLVSYVGLVCMNQNSPDILRQSSTEEAMSEVRAWLSETKDSYKNTYPIITPRFAPSCTEDLLKELGYLQTESGIPVQSHLSENFGEIAFVKELFPWSKFYGEVYDKYGLFGGDNCKTIMAHCVHCSEGEIKLLRERGVYIAHCPDSNTNLTSGVAPVRRYLQDNMNIGLGSDVSGGAILNLLNVMGETIRTSKLRYRLLDDSLKPVTVWESLYMATLGGGQFFGKVGSFSEGYEFDAVVLDDSTYKTPKKLTPIERLERLFYIGSCRDTVQKYVRGRSVL